jgi:hypothetical protein
MVDASAGTGAEWVLKLDVDVACLTPAWLDWARPGSALIGLQNGRGWSGMLGMARAIRRDALLEIHAGSDCAESGSESDAIHRAVRRRYLNEVWLWPHRPRAGGIFASMSSPAKAPDYRRLFSLVHCGTVARPAVPELLASFDPD